MSSNLGDGCAHSQGRIYHGARGVEGENQEARAALGAGFAQGEAVPVQSGDGGGGNPRGCALHVQEDDRAVRPPSLSAASRPSGTRARQGTAKSDPNSVAYTKSEVGVSGTLSVLTKRSGNLGLALDINGPIFTCFDKHARHLADSCGSSLDFIHAWCECVNKALKMIDGGVTYRDFIVPQFAFNNGCGVTTDRTS
eukprot:3932092-Rhodomonas_salina.2